MSRRFVLVVLVSLAVLAATPVAAPGSPSYCTITGTSGPDVLRGTSGTDFICGGGGADKISGAGGVDYIYGGAGRDRIDGGPGGDKLAGGGGADDLAGDSGADVIVGLSGPDLLGGGAGNDTLLGTDGSDVIRGADNDDDLQGGAGDDRLSGAAGSDVLEGGGGIDRLNGGDGLDTCRGDSEDPAPLDCEDTDAPAILGAEIGPASVDTSAAAKSVSFSVEAGDSLSGVKAVTAKLVHGPDAEGSSAQSSLDLTLGTAADGTWTGDVELPRYSRQGDWRVEVWIWDVAGNLLRVSPERLDTLGTPRVIAQTGVGDSAKPELTGFTVSPASVDTSGAPAELTVAAHAIDDLSGIGLSAAWVDGPAGFSTVAFLSPPGTSGEPETDVELISGVSLPRYAPSGHYSVSSVDLSDVAGNQRAYQTPELDSLGFSTGFDQVGPGDENAPVLAGFSASPRSFNTSTGAVDVTFSAHVTDDRSGVDSVIVDVYDPSGSTGWSRSAALISGDTSDGAWEGSMTIPQYSRFGDYPISVVVRDFAANYRWHYKADLAAAGFPGVLHNGP